MKAKFKYFDIATRKQLKICSNLENLTCALKQTYCNFLSRENRVYMVT